MRRTADQPTLWYVGWNARCWPQGHWVLRWDGHAWGVPFKREPHEMARTKPAEMPEGASAPEDVSK